MRLSKKCFSASQWEEYLQWKNEQRKKAKLQQEAQERLKKKKCSTTKQKKKKPKEKPKKALSRKEEYQLELKDERWKEKRLKVFKRDKFECILCHSKKKLNVHHTQYSNGKKAWDYPIDTLVTLCEECHKKVHSNRNHKLYPIIV